MSNFTRKNKQGQVVIALDSRVLSFSDFANIFFYAQKYHKAEQPPKVLATLELIYYIQCVGLVKDPKWTRTPPAISKWPHNREKTLRGPGGVPIKSIHVLQTPRDVHNFQSPQIGIYVALKNFVQQNRAASKKDSL